MNRREDEDLEFVPIPLDRETIMRMARFGMAIGEHPVFAAGRLLRDLFKDDEEAHRARPGTDALN